MKKKIHFIINPKSGGKSKNHIPALIEKYIDKEKFEFKISTCFSETETIQFAKTSIDEQVDYIVAVGGDGTINNIAKNTVDTETILGIIPMGSGNGFARELNLNGSIKRSLEVINRSKTKTVDTGTVNEVFFCNLAGVGFDAHVGGLFSKSNTRGLKTYAKIILNEFSKYGSKKYQLVNSNNENKSIAAFMICVCNGPQFGNNAFIAPNAKLDDGIFDITIVKPFPLWKTPLIAISLFVKGSKDLSFIERINAKEFTIYREQSEMVNIDGEPLIMGKKLDFKINPLSLNVLVP
jgi:YegS/Rv2252/BmrU family lipid kinase